MQNPAPATNVQYQGLFETPLITAQMNNASTLLPALRKVIDDRQLAQNTQSRSNIAGWQSDTDMLQWGGEPARDLGIQILQLLGRFTTDIGQTDPNKPRFEWSAEMWANVNPTGGAHESHTHPGALWSAVCFVNSGIGFDDPFDNAGKLVLQDPRHPLPVMYKPDMRFVNDKKEHYKADFRITPEDGKIAIFPSWLSHFVTPHKGSGKRISIAINFLTLPARS